MTVDIRLEDLPEAARKQYRDQVSGEIGPKRRQRQLQGRRAQSAGKGFEDAVLAVCDWYLAQRIAWLTRMPVPTVPAPKRDQRARGLRVLSGEKAPFDIYGYYIDTGRFIGAELKSTAKKEPRLPIVGEGKNRSGIQAHQLNALASVGMSGGLARIVWKNGSEIGVLRGPEILEAQERYYNGGRGTKSISWKWFTRAKNLDWLWLAAGRVKEKP